MKSLKDMGAYDGGAIIKGKDAFLDLLCSYMANNVTYAEAGADGPVAVRAVNHDHCPEGYTGMVVFVKKNELGRYKYEQ